MSIDECTQARVAIKAAVMALVREGIDKDDIADALMGTLVQMLVQYMPTGAVAQALRDTANMVDRPN